MSQYRLSMMALFGLVALCAAMAPASAQVYYDGYNLGPDYGAMIQQQLQQQQLMNQQMQQQQQQVIYQVMQNPQFQAMYQQHRAQGGQMTPEQFAYAYAATGGFSPEGIARYQQSESANQAAEQQSLQGLRQAEANRGQAQQQMMNSYSQNQQEAGNGLMGQGTYTSPEGNNYVLQNTQPGQVMQDAQGNQFVMDNQGNYYIQTPYGWQPMQPHY